MAELVGGVDVSGYNTCRNPDDFFADWRGYYRDAAERRDAVLAATPHELGVAYGEHPRQFANVFRPEDADGAPSILYFHGGGWREGHPDFYDHLAGPWVAAGAVFVSCGYRVMPEVGIDEEIDDAAAALAWWAANARRFGADPHRIVVAGHSAGGHLAAMAALTDRGPGLDGRDATVTGVICMSAPLNLIEDVLPDDPVSAEALSPATRLSRAPDAVLLSYAHPEPNKKSEPQDYDRRHAHALSRALDAAEIPHTLLSLGRRDHVATCLAFADTTSPLFAAARGVVFAASGR